jgi:hypothetical protein
MKSTTKYRPGESYIPSIGIDDAAAVVAGASALSARRDGSGGDCGLSGTAASARPMETHARNDAHASLGVDALHHRIRTCSAPTWPLQDADTPKI